MSRELLNELHDFPCVFTFKVIGRPVDGFVSRIVSIVREELLLETDPDFRLQETGSGKYVSITIEPEVQSAEQVLAIYSRISQTDDVVMTL